MSFNTLILNGQKPDKSGAITQSLNDLSDVSLSPSDGDVLGFGAGGVPSIVANPVSFDIAGSSWQSGVGWGGGGLWSVGDSLNFRLASQTATLDTSKVNWLSGGTWRPGFNISAGSYLISLTFPFAPTTGAGDYADIRLKNRTTNTLIGPKVRIGAGQSSNFSIFPIHPTSTTAYGWEVVAIGGAPTFANADQFTCLQVLIMELL